MNPEMEKFIKRFYARGTMINKVALTSLLVFLMVAAGCNHNGNVEEPSRRGGSFVGGSKALELSFIEGSPPGEVTDKPAGEDGFPFDATLVIKNVGEYDIPSTERMFITLSGFFPGDFGINNPNRELSIEHPKSGTFGGVKRDSEGNPIQGDIAYLRFPENDQIDFMYRKSIAVSTPIPFRAEVCYPYRTEAVSDMCLMDDLTSRDQPVCNPSGRRGVSNSGGPVHISSVTQSVAGKNKILLRFEVKKVGTSDLFELDYQKRCDDVYRNRNRILVEIDTGLRGLNCAGLIGGGGLGGNSESSRTRWSGDVLLNSDGTASFTCIQTLQENDRRDGIKTFNAAIDYFAKDAISTEVLVKHSLS